MKKVAFLFSGGINHIANYPRYRNNLGFARKVLMEKYGYAMENIYVMYANGQPFTYMGERISSIPAYKEEFYRLIEKFSKDLSPQDQFLFLTSNHGDYGEEALLNLWEEEFYTLTDIRDMLNMISCKKACIFGHCFGGYFKDCCSRNTIFISACSKNQKSHSCYPQQEYDEFLYHLLSYLNGAYPDGTVIVNESRELEKAFDFAFAHDMWNPACEQHVELLEMLGRDAANIKDRIEEPIFLNCLDESENFCL